MSQQKKHRKQSSAGGGVWRLLWQWKSWWLLPLAVLAILLAIIYALAHLSAADSEMYPTTMRHDSVSTTRC